MLRRARNLFEEITDSPTGLAVLCGASALAPRPARRAMVALAATAGLRTVLASVASAEREARNAGDAAVVSAILGEHVPPLGGWTAEADFALLIANELRRRPETVVECGSGLTTLLIAKMLKANGTGRLVSFEHDAAFADETRRRIQAAGVDDVVQLVVAPLREQSFNGSQAAWYDTDAIPESIDLLVVDGPPTVPPSARWPAVDVLGPRLAPQATVLMDDGRRGPETGAAMRWVERQPDRTLSWHDTVKGTWRLSPGSTPLDGMGRVVQKMRRTLNVHPNGWGRWPRER